MADLRSKIAAIAAQCAEKIAEAIASSTLEEIAALSKEVVAPPPTPPTPPARPTRRNVQSAPAPQPGLARQAPPTVKIRGRRGAAEIEKIASAVLTVLKLHPEGQRSEELQKSLGVTSRDLPRPLQYALEKKLVRKSGDKRSTRYFALT